MIWMSYSSTLSAHGCLLWLPSRFVGFYSTPCCSLNMCKEEVLVEPLMHSDCLDLGSTHKHNSYVIYMDRARLMIWLFDIDKVYGKVIQMEIDGRPPIPLAQNNCPLWQFPSCFFYGFSGTKLLGLFWGPTRCFLAIWVAKWLPSAFIWPQSKVVNLG